MTPFCVLNTKKNALQIMGHAAYASETNECLEILQAFDTVFHRGIKHLEVRQKYPAARRW